MLSNALKVNLVGIRSMKKGLWEVCKATLRVRPRLFGQFHKAHSWQLREHESIKSGSGVWGRVPALASLDALRGRLNLKGIEPAGQYMTNTYYF